MTPIELQRKGFKALVEALGVVDAIRFIHQYDSGKGDYTKERHQWLDNQNVEDVLTEMNQWKNVDNIAEYYQHLD